MKKQKFHQYKRPISIDNIEVDKIVVYKKVSFVKNRFRYSLATKILKPLLIFLPKMSVYRRDFDKTKCMNFLIKNDKLLKKYNEIWEKVINIIYKVVDSNSVYNEKMYKK